MRASARLSHIFKERSSTERRQLPQRKMTPSLDRATLDFSLLSLSQIEGHASLAPSICFLEKQPSASIDLQSIVSLLVSKHSQELLGRTRCHRVERLAEARSSC